MEDVISELKKIGIKNVSIKTLITEKNVKAIIDKDFKSLQRTKANGFIRIIEREFKVDLSEWQKEYEEYLKVHEIKDEEPFVMSESESENSSNKLINLFTYFIIFISVIGLFYILSDINSFKQEEEVKQVKDLVEEAKVNLETTKELNNSTLNALNESSDSNESEIEVIEANVTSKEIQNLKEIEEEVKSVKEFFIQPKVKLWIGIITLPEFKKRSLVTSEKIELDPSKEQLISLGHNRVEIFLNDKKINLGNKERFVYRDGNLTPLTFAEFRALNRGRNW